jgi:hypothetical protein
VETTGTAAASSTAGAIAPFSELRGREGDDSDPVDRLAS